MDNVYGQGGGPIILQLTAEEALAGCVKEVMLGNQRYHITIPAGTPAGSSFELRADNGFLLGTVSVQVTGSMNTAYTAAAAGQNAFAPQGTPFSAPQDTPYTAPQGAPYTASQDIPYTAPQGPAAGTQYNNYAQGAYGVPGAPDPKPKKKGKKTGLWVTLGIVAFLIVGGVLFYNFYHIYDDPTCTEPAICKICHKEVKPALGHDWMEATYDEPQTCARCGETTGDVKGMTYDVSGDWTGSNYVIGDWNYPIWGLNPPLEDVRKIQISFSFEELNADHYRIYYKSNGDWYYWDFDSVEGQTDYEEWFYTPSPMRIEEIVVTDNSNTPYSIYLGVTAAQCGK